MIVQRRIIGKKEAWANAGRIREMCNVTNMVGLLKEESCKYVKNEHTTQEVC